MIESDTRAKVQRYSGLVKSLIELGRTHAKSIATKRQELMYFYFVRCARLVSGIVLLVEHGYLSAAYALEKSVVDAVVNGLYVGYAADDAEVEGLAALTLKGKSTGSVRKRAVKLDATLSTRKTFMSGQFVDLMDKTNDYINEFAHGGILSTSLDVVEYPPQVALKVLTNSTLLLIKFATNVYILEDIDLSPLRVVMEEFKEARVA